MTDCISQAERSKLGALKMEATGRVIANFAWQHLRAAVTFRDSVISLEEEHKGHVFAGFFEDIRSFSSACLMSSAASLEALINELFIAHNGKLRSQLDNFEERFWGKKGIERKPILNKYQLALNMLGAEKLDEHSSPYRDAWSLIELRNALVHYKPTWDPEWDRIVELTELLEGRFPTSPFLDDAADFVSMKCMSAGCAKWAVATTLSFIREFDARANLDSKKMQGFWKLKT